MKERYLFRGKSTHGVKWIEGDLLLMTYLSGRVEYKIHERIPQATCWLVRPQTVSAYIRRKDKHGRKIFEGDILRAEFDGEVDFFVVRYVDDVAGYLFVNATRKAPPTEVWSQEDCTEGVEVIGNRWENPDMISAEVWEVLA